MLAARHWSVRHARGLETAYGLFERVVVALHPLWERIGYGRAEKAVAIVERMAGAADPARKGRRLCVELIQEICEIRGVAGVHVMAYRQEEAVAEVIAVSGVLGGRIPWHPARDPSSQPHEAAT